MIHHYLNMAGGFSASVAGVLPGPLYGSKLSDEATIFFISLVEHLPALWDTTVSEYANSLLKCTLWQQVADKMEDRFPECGPYVPDALRLFFTNKRRTYRTEKKKLGAPKNGQASGECYRGRWKFFHCLTFLDAAKPVGARTYSEAFEAAEPEAVESEASPEQNAEQEVDQDAEQDAGIEESPQPSPAAVSTATSSIGPRKVGSSQPSADDWAARTTALEKIADAVQRLSETDDAATHFSKVVAALLRPMKPVKLVRCQAEILNVIEKHLSK
ncbi:uncharacterized protein LOC115317647 [Ixodes scapularis]|uniref:uncharacterized protein LOC115317647 n=1 Tax=Ixodes scapularis TaxID=6945 RepID=UPI001A9F5DCC|nr:uncharacterized protein LOC115317647 [Ixodes scapularis]